MKEKKTNELDSELAGVKPEDVGGFIKQNSEYLKENDKAFYYFIKDTIQAKNIKLKDVYSFAGLTEGYGSKLISMEKHTKNRDVIIRLCIAGHFNLEEVNRALKLYGMSPLYSKDQRDACIIVAINNRKYNFIDIDLILEENGFSKLSVD